VPAKKTRWWLLTVALVLTGGCSKSPTTPEPPPSPPLPPPPLTESQRDFRYVTPVLIENLIYLVFVDWSDPQYKTLWISDLDGTDLRELNGTGDEPVFVMLGLPAARSDVDLERAALEYSFRFDQ